MNLKKLTVASTLILVPFVSAHAQTTAARPSAQQYTVMSAAAAPAPTVAAAPPTVWLASAGPARQITLPSLGGCFARLGEGLTARHVWTIQHTRLVRQRPIAVYYTAAAMPAAAMPAAAAALATPQHQVYQLQPAPPAPSPMASRGEEAPPAPAVPDLAPAEPVSQLQLGRSKFD